MPEKVQIQGRHNQNGQVNLKKQYKTYTGQDIKLNKNKANRIIDL